MTFVVVLVCALLACFMGRNFIKNHPVTCYAFAIGVDLAFVYGYYFGFPREIWLAFFVLIQKCMLPLALFVIVMYMGVLPQKVKASTALLTIRSNISVIAWLLSLGHMGVYLGTYITPISAGVGVRSNVLVAFIIAIVVFILLMVLGITSFNFMKRRMSGAGWKKVQKLAYPFFLLTYVHLVVMLMPSGMRGGQAAQVTVGVYSAVFLTYFALRLLRFYLDRRQIEQKGEPRSNPA